VSQVFWNIDTSIIVLMSIGFINRIYDDQDYDVLIVITFYFSFYCNVIDFKLLKSYILQHQNSSLPIISVTVFFPFNFIDLNLNIFKLTNLVFLRNPSVASN